MATVGAFNGTGNVIRVHNGTIWQLVGGQISHSQTLNNALLDITNKEGTPGYRELLPDHGIQSVDYTVECVFNTQAAFTYLRGLANSKALAHFQILRGDVATGTVDTEAYLMVQSFADNSSDGEPLKATISLLSSDAFQYEAGFTYARLLTSASEPYVTSSGEYYYVRN